MRSGQGFDQDFGPAAGGFVAFAAGGGEEVGGAFGEPAFGLKPGKGLGGEGDEAVHAGVAGFIFDVLDQAPADALIFVGGADVEVGQFGEGLFGVQVEGDTSDGVAVDFVEVIILDLTFHLGAGAFHEFGGIHRFTGEEEDLADVLFEGAADLFVFIGIDEGADAFVGKDLGEEGFILTAVDEMDAGDTGTAGLGGEEGFGEEFGGEIPALAGEEVLEFGGEDLADEAAAAEQAFVGSEVDDFGGLEGFAESDGDGVGIDAVGVAFTVEAEGGDDGNDALGEEGLQEFGINPFDLAGELVVATAEDTERMGDDGVGGSGPEVVGGQAFEDFVGEAVGGGEGKFEGFRIGHAGAIEVGGGTPGVLRQLADHGRGAVDQEDADIEGAQDGDIEEDIGEVVVHDDGGIEAEHEGAFPEAGDVTEDAAEVGGFHESQGPGAGPVGRRFSAVARCGWQWKREVRRQNPGWASWTRRGAKGVLV